MKPKKATSACSKCSVFKCYPPTSTQHKSVIKEAEYPTFCPHENHSDVREWSIEKEWKKPETDKINQAHNEVMKKQRDQAGNYTWCRIRELIEYSKNMGYKKLGLGFCAGLREEARVLTDILEKGGFEVVSVSCMSGSATRDEVGFDVGCNPIMQAEVLNKEKTELNILFGLCLGHDILFIKYLKGDVTPLVVKDRILAHNPLGAIYTSRVYYQKKLYPQQ